MVDSLKAVEFFSGIGAFAEACRDSPINVIAAFDQNEHANKVYESNFQLSPAHKNLESINPDDIPDASIWWMSPPCTPFSRRGKQKDDEDPRARAFLNLIAALPSCKPEYFFMENVEGFAASKVNERLQKTLIDLGYKHISFNLCSSMFGVPMRRPRHFIAASRTTQPKTPEIEAFADPRTLRQFLIENDEPDLILSESELEKYRPVLNIVDAGDPEAYLICFTRGYYKCRKASGSLVRTANDGARFVSPSEILDLFGFSPKFKFPTSLSMSLRWRLIGNSVDVRAVKAVLSTVGLRHC
jgi:site-specific DNA-cytosine methylase